MSPRSCSDAEHAGPAPPSGPPGNDARPNRKSRVKIQHPFRTALLATLGVGVGVMIITGITTLSTVLLDVGTALFLSLGLDPLVSWLERRGLPRWAALLVTFAAVLAAF